LKLNCEQAMTQQQWETASEPQTLLESIADRISDRKLRLFAVGCCRTIDSMLTATQQRALGVAERYADEPNRWKSQLFEAAADVVQDAAESANGYAAMCVHATLYTPALHDAFFRVTDSNPEFPTTYSADAFSQRINFALLASIYAASAMASYSGAAESTASQEPILEKMFSAHADLLRDIAGEPSASLSDSNAPLSRVEPEAESLARHIYTTSSFERIGALARLLHRSGVSSPLVMSHLGDRGRHVRGCALVDQILGFK
jgi:hypothetical protein